MQTLLIVALDNAGSEHSSEFFHVLQPLVDWTPQSDIRLRLRRLPYIFKQCLIELEKLITEFQPAYLLLLAQQPGKTQISIEKVALNINDAITPDNKNQQPRDSRTAEHGPAAYFCNLPASAIADHLRHQAIPAHLSYYAGTDVANHAFYGMMHYIKHHNTNLHGGLMQFPLLPQQACNTTQSASISSEYILNATKIAVSICLACADNMLHAARNQV